MYESIDDRNPAPPPPGSARGRRGGLRPDVRGPGGHAVREWEPALRGRRVAPTGDARRTLDAAGLRDVGGRDAGGRIRGPRRPPFPSRLARARDRLGAGETVLGP